MPRNKPNKQGVTKGRIRVHDPFELVRWLALSQTDPRKALAELVQNSLDAGAGEIRITRQRLKRQPALRIWDDGEGVIPELERPAALQHLATHIGHSRKRSLTPQQRLELMTQGQYGIGLLGFWSLGSSLELRSSLPGHRAHRLVLYRDRPDYVVEPLRGRLPLGERWTEVIVHGLHRDASRVLTCRRAADYLAAELRGQLLARDVRLTVHDRIARGRALKRVAVQPPRFLGERLEGLGPIAVPERPPIQIELYAAGDSTSAEATPGIALYVAGSLVAESFAELSALGLDHPPWTDRRLTGMVDFPALTVAPGTRRGVVADATASTFARALLDLEPAIELQLEAMAARRSEALDQRIVRELQRAFRDFYRQSPSYALLPVASDTGPEAGNERSDGSATTGVAVAEPAPAHEGDPTSGSDALPERSVEELFPPGPLASVEIAPSRLRIPCGGSRRVKARPFDANGQNIHEATYYTWVLDGVVGTVQAASSDSPLATVTAGDLPGDGRLYLQVESMRGSAETSIPATFTDRPAHADSDEGIPEPELVDEPGRRWRSRLEEGRWQVNAGHRDFSRIAQRPTLKLRYLALLFAKEVVLRSRNDPRLEDALEQLVEVAAYADERISARRGGRRSSGERAR